MLDNASSNDSAVKKLCDELNIKEKPEYRRLRCVGHILNLAAQACLWGTDYEAFEYELRRSTDDIERETRAWRSKGPIGVLRSIVYWIVASPSRLSKFRWV